ncbi:MAG: exodeoxyribonuclease VII small subunit [Halobacteriota archaeon]|nr:exodeoxyribonuclease VII small subunit [Halobacteriota archaeon]MDY6958724.1 exodeoxyribonuclease VII small subunit [Halobacteriota archaeon]
MIEDDISFEDALEKLENIVQKLEDGGFSLEESLKLFEEGVFLSRLCYKKLNEAEGKIEKLIEREGDVRIETFGLEG